MQYSFLGPVPDGNTSIAISVSADGASAGNVLVECFCLMILNSSRVMNGKIKYYWNLRIKPLAS